MATRCSPISSTTGSRRSTTRTSARSCASSIDGRPGRPPAQPAARSRVLPGRVLRELRLREPLPAEAAIVEQPYPVEDVDFSYGGAYAQYNWELFFHAPLLIAVRLTKNQRFADAQRWLHYIFDPTDASADDDAATVLADASLLRERRQPKPIEELLKLLDYARRRPASRALREDLEHQVEEWREHPFDPHLLARLRTGRVPGDTS